MRFLLLSCIFGFGTLISAHAVTRIECVGLLWEKTAFARIAHKKNQSLHMTREVVAEQERLRRLGQPFENRPAEKIVSFIDALERIHSRAQISESAKERLRKDLHRRFVIRPEEVPESYFEQQILWARERGRGNLQITTTERSEMIENLIEAQKRSLDSWFDYFLSTDASSFPFYIKYWSFTSLLKFSKFDPEAGKFLKRSRGTTAPFPELNREALAKVADPFIKSLKGEVSGEGLEPSYKTLLDRADFGALYGQEIKKILDQERGTSTSIAGVWVKYPQGSNPEPLVLALEGQNTGWCTAVKSTAWAHLREGDFYVYFTLDQAGKYTLPRVAIRMREGKIDEIRGIAKDQNLDPAIAGSNVIEMKLKDFGAEGDLYAKRDSDMKRLTKIDRKFQKNEPLSKEDLRYLYEIDSKIEGFGHERDPRISEILSSRQTRTDLAWILGLKESEISLTTEEALKGGIKFHLGDLELWEMKSGQGVTLPEAVGGSLKLGELKSLDGLILPRSIGGSLDLSSLKSAVGLKLPESIPGSLDLSSLLSAEGLVLPKSIGGSLNLGRLTSVEGLIFPRSIGKHLGLGSIWSAKGVILPDSVGGDLDLHSLIGPDGLVLPGKIGGRVYLPFRYRW